MAFYFSDKDGNLIKYAGLVGSDPNELNKKLDKELSDNKNLENVQLNLFSSTDYINNFSSDDGSFGNTQLTKMKIDESDNTSNFSSYILNGAITSEDFGMVGFNNLVSNSENINTISDLFNREETDNGTYSLLQHGINPTTQLPSLSMMQTATIVGEDTASSGQVTNILQIGSIAKDLVTGFQYSGSTEDSENNASGINLQVVPGLINIGYDISSTGNNNSHTQFQIMSFAGLASAVTHKINNDELALSFSSLTKSAALEVKNDTEGVATGLIIKDQKLY